MTENQIKRRTLVAKNPWHYIEPGQDAPKVVRALI